MDLKSIKIDLIHWLTELQDPDILKQLYSFKEKQENELSEDHNTLLDQRLDSYNKNPDTVIEWSKAMEDLEKDL
ncbi:addiction module protein [Fulvivirga maritima]|uniref:addiction module protein n=1 Tax=Fulvivirga maritima TaxID=2904247 RepID=UPI001F1A2BDD|nr:addiction module protein [Fulvivirga maritima]UII27113.1 addiction module protein [Fulvivirga maritima]